MNAADFDPARYRRGPRRKVVLVTIGPPLEATRARKDTMSPLDEAYLAAAARAAGHRVSVASVAANEDMAAFARRSILPARPDIVGLSCYLSYRSDFGPHLALAAAVKAARPGTHVCFNGGQSGGPAGSCLTDPSVDSACVGECEVTFCELLGALGRPRALAKVLGLWYRDARGRVRRNPPRPPVLDVDTLPMPAIDLYEPDAWMTRLSGRPLAPIFGARGCPFRCTFCPTKAAWGRRYRPHSPERVVAEMNRMWRRWGVSAFGFYDSTFTLDRARTLRLCALIASEGARPFRWVCDTRADLVDEELLAAMKGAGCDMVSYGFESGNQRILDMIDKKCTLAQYRRAADLTRAAGIKIGAHFILGFPTETPQETARTISFARSLAPDRTDFNLLTPFPGTALHAAALRAGQTPEDWAPEGRTKAELLKWRAAGRRFLLTPAERRYT